MTDVKKRVCVVGSGNWGSAIAKIVGNNVLAHDDMFETEVFMYVYEEIVNGQKLTDIINSEHENVKYLPEIKLPANVIAVPDVVKACNDADILIFVLPHQFVKETCLKMKQFIKPNALGISLIKGFILTESDGIQLVSKVISETLGIETAVLMGANLATEVASEMFCETTIACENESYKPLLTALFETSYFRCKVIKNVAGVEACGALKNVVGIGAGIVDGLGYGDNTKAAVIRLGLMEMMKFTKVFLGNDDKSVFFESCGVADLVATCHGGRNRLLGEAVVKSMKKRGIAGVDIRLLEKEILRGQSFQGPLIAKEIYSYLKDNSMLEQFPLLVAIHRICTREVDPRNFIDCLRDHPEHM
ncbi:glycerol-3-phosphate dehydrogenase [NAD(+)] cytoplasmic-like isoform X1 [Biomphalaria glabrata]|uniref:Glycerol-3-phosphate dehydrogenase [NAD(+)] n=1 Tax=Biomphalaria glabrata TaxID=6526 RepID=A0A2C9JE80_BIOGL|nr:glycerol-3-phosphate dehydrogenase [NAD(+)], cytoplasmic-like isoform X1 [Biomphalaria glabrata]KAI8743872.1 glycerol-3-phosphate dehydrogenase [NAD(+)]; cytoplasmic-like isoform X1 [Biomphalaria glabrata]